MRQLAGWCDEASYVRWIGAWEPVDWAAAHRRMVAEGQASHVVHPSATQLAKAWAPPRRSFRLL